MKYFFKQIALKPKAQNLSGFAKREVSSQTLGIESLHLSILWLKYEDDNIVFIALDSLYIPTAMALPTYKLLEKLFNLKPHQVIFNASHTHSAPAIEEIFDKVVDVAYIEYLNKSIESIFSKKLHFEEGFLDIQSLKLEKNLFISRRQKGRDIRRFFLKEKMLLLPNIEKEIDRNLKLFILFDRQRDIKLIVYSFACHPVFNKNEDISSDFIGQISQYLEDSLGVKSIFLQGFLGDIRPAYITSDKSKVNSINKLKLLFNKSVFRPYDKSYFDFFTQSIAQEIIKYTKQKFLEYKQEEKSFKSISHFYDLTSSTGLSMRRFEIKYLVLEKYLFISIPAEVTSAYALHISKTFPHINFIFLGLSDTIIGYLPFYEEASEGGYEVHSAPNYAWDSALSQISLKNFYQQMLEDIASLIKDEESISC